MTQLFRLLIVFIFLIVTACRVSKNGREGMGKTSESEYLIIVHMPNLGGDECLVLKVIGRVGFIRSVIDFNATPFGRRLEICCYCPVSEKLDLIEQELRQAGMSAHIKRL